MKIRIMATENECILAKNILLTVVKSNPDLVYSISGLYPCRNSNLYRLYIEIQGTDMPIELNNLLRGAP